MYLIDGVLGSLDPQTRLSSDISINASAVESEMKLSDADFFNAAKVKPDLSIYIFETKNFFSN